MELRIGVVVTVWRDVDEPVAGIDDDEDKVTSVVCS